MPSHAHLMVEDGEAVYAGHVLAKTPGETIKTGGLPRVVELFEAERPGGRPCPRGHAADGRTEQPARRAGVSDAGFMRLGWRPVGPRRERRCTRIWSMRSRRSCTFFIGDAAIAQALDPIDFPDHVAAWLLEGATLAELAGRGVELGRHAEVLESGDAARWHWLRVRDRVANPEDVLAPLAPLISLVIASPIASRFYSFSSLNRLCFSASSHYPFVGQYPVVYPGPDGKYFVDDVPCSLRDAVARIESALAASSIEPFFGSATDYEATLLAESLGRHGSAIQPRIIRRGSSSDVWLIVPPRQCSVADTILECFGEGRKVCVICRCVDDIVALALRFLNDGASHEDVTTDPRVVRPCAGPSIPGN